MKFKITYNCLLGVLILCFFCSSTFGFDTIAKSAIVIDEETNSIILEKNADQPLPPASMSKLMTLLLAFEALEEGRINLRTEFRVSNKAFKKGGSKMFVEENQMVSVEDLIRGIIIASGNDACIVMAEGLNGTEKSFVSRMNLKAKEIGLKNSNFTNSTGWPSPGHMMSARDLLTLAIYVRKNYPNYYHYFQEIEYTWNGISQNNRNPLLSKGIGVDGLKTGHTEEAGYGLVGSSILGNRRISFVLTGLDTKADRKFEGEKITKWAFREFTITNIFPENHFLIKAPVWIGSENYVDLFTSKKIQILLPYGKKNEVKAEVHIETPLKTPINKNDIVGVLKIIAPSFILGQEKRIIEYPIVSHSDIYQGNITKKIQATARIAILKAINFANLSNIFK